MPLIEKRKAVERQRYKKKLNVIEVNGRWYREDQKHSKWISDTVAELYVPQNHDANFPELNQMEEQKTIHMNHSNTENSNKTFSKEELVTKNYAHGPDKIHNEILKHIQTEGLDFLLRIRVRIRIRITY